MGIDDEDKRSRARTAASGVPPIMPVPDGTVDAEDRAAVSGIYSPGGGESPAFVWSVQVSIG